MSRRPFGPLERKVENDKILAHENLLKPTFWDTCVTETIVFVDPTFSKPLKTYSIWKTESILAEGEAKEGLLTQMRVGGGGEGGGGEGGTVAVTLASGSPTPQLLVCLSLAPGWVCVSQKQAQFPNHAINTSLCAAHVQTSVYDSAHLPRNCRHIYNCHIPTCVVLKAELTSPARVGINIS